MLKGQLPQEFIWKALLSAKNRAIISAYLQLLEEVPGGIDLNALVHFCLRAKVCSVSLVRIIAKDLPHYLERLFPLILQELPVLHEVIQKIDLNAGVSFNAKRMLIDSISIFIQKDYKSIALNSLAKFLAFDSFAALKYEQFVLDSFYQQETEDLAYTCIILSMNQSNYLNVRQLIQQRIAQSSEEERNTLQQHLHQTYSFSERSC